MKCIVCDQRKAKRFCPAKNASICAQCCGEKRILEIDCPESCEYLKVGRIHLVREYARYLRLLDAETFGRVMPDNKDVIAHFEQTVAEHRLTMRDLSDRVVAEALQLLIDAYKTEEKGILYEKSAHDLQVESLRRQLREIIEHHRDPKKAATEGLIGSKEKRLSLRQAIECLEFLRELVGRHMAAGGSPTSYVDLMARLVPRQQPSGDMSRSIIIP